MANNTVSPARKAAFDILLKVAGGSFSSAALASEETQLSSLDRALCHELVLGVLRWQLNLDRVIEHFANRKIETLDEGVRVALRLGLYQLFWLGRIPPHAAVHETVELAKRAGFKSQAGLINAILRAYMKGHPEG